MVSAAAVALTTASKAPGWDLAVAEVGICQLYRWGRSRSHLPGPDLLPSGTGGSWHRWSRSAWVWDSSWARAARADKIVLFQLAVSQDAEDYGQHRALALRLVHKALTLGSRI